MSNTIYLCELEKDPKLKGLTYNGFIESHNSFEYEGFDLQELYTAYEVVREWDKTDEYSYGRLTSTLQDVVGNLVRSRTMNQVQKVSHGTLILALYLAGFHIDHSDRMGRYAYVNVDFDNITNSIQAYLNRQSTMDYIFYEERNNLNPR